MMGNNELILNELSVREAIQEWLNARMKEGQAPIVAKVTPVSTGSMGQEFRVRLEQPKNYEGEE